MKIANRLVSVMKQFLKVKKKGFVYLIQIRRGFHGFSLNYFLSGGVFQEICGGFEDFLVFYCEDFVQLYIKTIKT